MRLYLDSFYFRILYPMENLSKKISLAKRNSSILTKVHLAFFQVALLRLFS